MQPEIGVLVITHNESERIVETIESILSQEKVSVKIFISDNNSTDSTVEKVNFFQTRESQVQIRHEPSPLKSVYQHSASAYLYFLEDNQDIEYWTILNAGDSWTDPLYLNELHERICTISSENDNAFCAYPAIEVYSFITKTSKIYVNNFAYRSGFFRLLIYWLMPRYRQPLTLFFGLMNRKALHECIIFCRRIDDYRIKSATITDRSPEAETFYSFDLLRKIRFILVKNKVFKYGIHDKSVRDSSKIFDKEQSISVGRNRIQKIVRAHSYPYYYFRQMRSFLPILDRVFILITLPVKLSSEYAFNFIPILIQQIIGFLKQDRVVE